MEKWEVYQIAHETHWGFCIQDTSTKKYKEVSECHKTESDAYKALANYLQAEIERLKKEIIWRKKETARADKNESQVDITTDHLEKAKKRIDGLKTQLTEADKVIETVRELWAAYGNSGRNCLTEEFFEAWCKAGSKGHTVAWWQILGWKNHTEKTIKFLAEYDDSKGSAARREPESRVELINRIQGNVRVEIEESDATLTDAMETHSDLMNLGDALFNQPSEMKTSDEITDRIGGLKKGRESEQDEDTIGAYNTIINALNWVLGKGPKQGGDYVATPQPSDGCNNPDCFKGTIPWTVGDYQRSDTYPRIGTPNKRKPCPDCKGSGKADG